MNGCVFGLRLLYVLQYRGLMTAPWLGVVGSVTAELGRQMAGAIIKGPSVLDAIAAFALRPPWINIFFNELNNFGRHIGVGRLLNAL